jgi:hypothetical protein
MTPALWSEYLETIRDRVSADLDRLESDLYKYEPLDWRDGLVAGLARVERELNDTIKGLR